MSGVAVGAVISAGSVAASTDAARKAGHDQRDINTPQGLVQFKTAELRLRLARLLEKVSHKKLNNEPLTAAEQNLINKTNALAIKKIEEQRKESRDTALGELAGVGRLKSGETASQLRRLNIQSGEAKQRSELARELALQSAAQRDEEFGLRAATAAMGVQQPQFQQFDTGLAGGALLGSGLGALGGALMQYGGQQAAADSNKKFLLELEQQRQINNIKASQGSNFSNFDTTTFGGTT
jgi:hypothetical protein